MSEPKPPPVILRDATAADVATILALVRGLAEFEREPHAVVASEADLLRDGFGATPRFQCRLAEIDGRAVAFTLYFFNYSTWLGRVGLYLEDIFIEDAARGLGLGRLLLADLARIALREGASRLDLAVLDWNPAREFYEHLGFQHRTPWLPYRLQGAALAALAESAPNP